jgi:hypothetical protein
VYGGNENENGVTLFSTTGNDNNKFGEPGLTVKVVEVLPDV